MTKKLAQRLEAARVDLDLTYDELAAQFARLGLSVSRYALFGICAGTWPHKVTARTARKIERFLEWAVPSIEMRDAKAGKSRGVRP